MEITDTLSPNPALANSQSNRYNHQPQPGNTQVNQGETEMKTGQILWSIKQSYRVVFYTSFGFNLQQWSEQKQKWYSLTFSRNADAFKQTDYA
jgi:hypothetical protein